MLYSPHLEFSSRLLRLLYDLLELIIGEVVLYPSVLDQLCQNQQNLHRSLWIGYLDAPVSRHRLLGEVLLDRGFEGLNLPELFLLLVEQILLVAVFHVLTRACRGSSFPLV